MTVELSNKSMITVDGTEKLTIDDIKSIVNNYIGGEELLRLQQYDDYYESDNTFIKGKVVDKHERDKLPNNYVPTAYYSTVVDTMAGYMFDDISYLPKQDIDKEYAQTLNDILNANNADVKDMRTGVKALAYNKGIELVYTTGTIDQTDIKFTDIDPRQMILIYNMDIEPSIFCGIWVRMSTHEDYKYKVDVIYKDVWQYYNMNDQKVVERETEKKLYFSECPVIVYNSNDMSSYSSYKKIIPYINALDYLITGNANDIEKLTDAILVLTGIMLKDDELDHMDEIKAIMGLEPEAAAKYLTKDADPAFRQYATQLLIYEIHKHSHVVDWYNPDAGLSGEISAKAMITRLFDMDISSNRIEKPYKLGSYKRIKLITELMFKKRMPVGEIEIIYKRTLPNDFQDLAPILNNLTFISEETKMEMIGADVEKETERMGKQKTANMERIALNMTDDVDPDLDDEGDE